MTDMRISSKPAAWDATQSAIENARRAQAQAGGAAIAFAARWLGRAIKGAWATVLTWHRNARAMNELAQCSDWTLADIGVRREQIRNVVQGGAQRHQVPVGNPVKPVMLHVRPDNDQAARKVA